MVNGRIKFIEQNTTRADREISPFLMLSLPQRFTHRGAGVCFADGIEVAIDVGGSTHVAVSEPFLDLLHWHALGEEHRGAGVALIVGAYFLQRTLSLKPTVILIICVIDN